MVCGLGGLNRTFEHLGNHGPANVNLKTSVIEFLKYCIMDVSMDGEIYGMLSVNAYRGH